VGIKQANRLICLESTRGLFVTLFYSQIDPDKNTLTYVNAGHNPPLFYQLDNDTLQELTKTGMALGIEENTQYEQRKVFFKPGDFILLYTDGISEAFDPSYRQFGTERLKSVVYENRHTSADRLLSALGEAVETFISPSAPSDDITIVIARKL
jgi:sigma-B regulation protein RsbU (phosphoserine phosphatase)